MVLIISMFFLTFILLIGFFVLSINFYIGDFQNLYSNFYQSQIVVNQNVEINSGVLYTLNTDAIGNNDYKCYDSSKDYQDNDCLFRSIMGFLPPNETIDLGVYEDIYGSGIIFEFTGDVLSGFDIVLTDVVSNLKTNKTVFLSGYLSQNFDGNNIGLKITNNSDQWNQFIISLSGSDGLIDFDSNYGESSLNIYYNYYLSTKKLFVNDVDMSYTRTINIQDLLVQRGIYDSLTGKISTSHFNGSNYDYLGSIIVEDIDNINPGKWIYLQTGFDAVLCSGSLNGYYWNPDISNTLRPLDQTTLLYWQGTGDYYDDVIISGGLYTYCSGTYDNLNTIYGKISWYFSGQEMLNIQTAREYDYLSNTVSVGNSLTESLQLHNYFGQDIPIGIIYDSQNGLAFVGGEMSTGSILQNLITNTNAFNKVLDYISSVNDDSIFFTNDIGTGTWAERY